jgi:hypothetical protein
MANLMHVAGDIG